MEDYVEQIEKFLRGNMSKEEEHQFKTSVKVNPRLRLYAFIVAIMLRK